MLALKPLKAFNCRLIFKINSKDTFIFMPVFC